MERYTMLCWMRQGARKGVYGDKKSNIAGYKEKIKIGADNNYFELVENADYDGSQKEQGKLR